MHACLRLRTYIHTHTHTHIYIYIYIYVHPCMHACMHACMYVCMHKCNCLRFGIPTALFCVDSMACFSVCTIMFMWWLIHLQIESLMHVFIYCFMHWKHMYKPFGGRWPIPGTLIFRQNVAPYVVIIRIYCRRVWQLMLHGALNPTLYPSTHRFITLVVFEHVNKYTCLVKM